MQQWTAREEQAARWLIERALAEDLDIAGDITTQTLIPGEAFGRANVVARQDGVVCGLPIPGMVWQQLGKEIGIRWHVGDGDRVHAGMVFGEVSGPLADILTAERTVLNFLQRLSGIASLTRRFVDAVSGTGCLILDTRKTTPGWRILEKYAVRCGGGVNHRLGLYDGILIKDNHLAILRQQGLSVQEAIRRVRERFGRSYPIEIEADTLEEVTVALQSGADIILLDNMDPAKIRQAVALRNDIAPHVILEASGGISLANVRAVAETGVERISIGALTHSAPALDIALDYVGPN
jgi:nicotinate-nucleotide pyrophosphorylase (carboxylating)